MSTASIQHLALIGNFLPRKCGLATFTTDTHEALLKRYPHLRVDVYAMDDHPGRYHYPEAVTAAIPQNDRSQYVATAKAIEASGAQALWVQHEYGIYGGLAGEYLIALLDHLTIPVISTLHTILDQPTPDEFRVMEALLRRSSRVIVMAERGGETLKRVHGVSPAKLVMIPHGVPDRPFANPDAFKPAFGWEGRDVILTFGLLAPNKGIETMIEAMPAVVAAHPNALYVVLGATHPNLVAYEGEAYRNRLSALAAERGVAAHVEFIDAFVEKDELIDYLQAADIYVTPYTNPAQITSGTLSYAVGVGKAVISTPYVHATEILDQEHGILIGFHDHAGFARQINRLLGDRHARHELSRRAYARGRTMLWSQLAERGLNEFNRAISGKPHRLKRAEKDLNPLVPDLGAVLRMTDSTGMLQHSIYSVPDRRHGYCIDDNARALILMSRIDTVERAERDELTSTYASFVQHAWNEDKQRFRNFMNFDRSWCEDAGSEDSNGRAIWSLGVTAHESPIGKHRDWALALFNDVAPMALGLGSPRASAFAMLGAASMLQAHPGHALSEEILRSFGDRLVTLLEKTRRPAWRWFEIVLAYDNARLPEALLRAGKVLDEPAFTALGLETLEWIVERQTSPEGLFRAVGTESFGLPFAEPAMFDQQPLEAQTTIDACVAAFAASGDRRWVGEAMRAYRWYLGANDLGLPLASVQDGGCFDGLMPHGLNRNQGAESILALQLSNCAIASLLKSAAFVAGSAKAVA